MIVQNMSNKEILSEILKDDEELVKRLYSHLHSNKIHRKLMKEKKFPFHHWHELKTKNKNVFLIHFNVDSRSLFRKDLFTFDVMCLVDTDKGKYVYTTRIKSYEYDKTKTNVLIIYQPHFFKRYAERFGIEVSGKELIKLFFTENKMEYGSIGDLKWKDSDDSDFCCYMNRGIALGHVEKDGTVHYNTVLEKSQYTRHQAEIYQPKQSLEIMENGKTFLDRTA